MPRFRLNTSLVSRAGQHRLVDFQTLFDYELCVVPAPISDEYECLRTGTTFTLVSKHKVDDRQPAARSIVIVDGQQHRHRIVWPCDESRQQHEGHTQLVQNINIGKVTLDRYGGWSTKE